MYLKRYIHKDGHFKIAVVDATGIGRKAFAELSPAPIDLQLITQGMAGALLLASSIKDEGSLQFVWRGDGPMGHLTVETNTVGDVRACVGNPCTFPRDPSVGMLQQAVGHGTLTARRRIMPSDKIYESVVPLGEGELAMSLARYLLNSQQVRAGIQLGASLDPELGIKGAGGVLVEALPEADDNLLFIIEDRLSTMQPLGDIFGEENGHALLYDHLLEGLGVKALGDSAVRYHCSCSRQRTLQAMASLPVTDLVEMRDEEKSFEIQCSFCSKAYKVTHEDLGAIIDLKQG